MEVQPRRSPRLSRRRLLLTGCAAASTGTLPAGCEWLATNPDRRIRRDANTADPEAPMLAELVAAGTLPSLAQRLPDRPLVVSGGHLGVYGGDWRMAVTGQPGAHWLLRTIGYEHLVRWRPDVVDFSFDEVVPNLAEKFQASADRRRYTFQLRQGVKWSDGTPFTADDIVFAYEDVLLHENAALPAAPTWLTPDEVPATLEKLDDYTLRFEFEQTNSLFLQKLATPDGGLLTSYPAHYLKKFHADHNDDSADLARQEGYSDWVDLFIARSDPWAHDGILPTLNAWIVTAPLTGATQRVEAERNPYYWKVDTDSRQLPYIDRVSYDIIGDPEVILLRMSNGDIDMMDPFETELQDKPVLARSRDAGNYHFIKTLPSWMNTMMLALNLTSQDGVKRQVFGQRDFRIGLSHAINREEIIDVVYQRQGEPWQGAPRQESSFYDDEMARQYTRFDVTAANRHLDHVLPDKDPDGRRLGPDGNVFSFEISVATSLRPDWVDVLELVRDYWRAVGVESRIRGVDRSLFYERKETNLHDAAVWYGDGGLEVALEPRWYFPFSSESLFAVPWATWFNSPESEGAIEPPPAAMKQMSLYRQLEESADPAERDDLMRNILHIAKTEFWAMGISMLPRMYGVVSNRLRNVPSNLLNAWLFATPGPTNPSAYYLEEQR